MVLKSKKHVFWEALLIAIVIFVLGLLFGVAYEGNKLDQINEYYALSEISLMDSVALNSLTDLNSSNCGFLIDSNIDFANRIYEEAKLLERYEAAGRITEDMKIAHRKYDLLRTFLWINSIKTRNKCIDDFDVVVYLYEYETEDLVKKATQNVWSKVLFDLKQERGESLILIPIAVDSDLTSLDLTISQFGINSYPSIVINDKFVVSNLTSSEDLMQYLD